MFGFGFITNRYSNLKKKTITTTNNTLEAFLKLSIVLLSVFTIIWISIFLYVAFYYTYVPSIEHIKPASLEFSPCDSGDKAVCSFPWANIILTKSNQFLMIGQPYRITVTLEVPESDENRSLGMFLVCGQLHSKSLPVAHSCRSAMLRYRSPLLKALKLLTLGGLYMFNFLEEKQILEIELFSNYEEDQQYPVTSMHVELKSERIQVYSAKVRIDAHLTGLRYLMFYWPTTSSILGVMFNIIVILFVVVLSWWQLYGPHSLTVVDSLQRYDEGCSSNKGQFSLSQPNHFSSFERTFQFNNSHVEINLIEGKEKEEEETEGEEDNMFTATGYLKLKDEFEDDEDGERKFVLERKFSSSEA